MKYWVLIILFLQLYSASSLSSDLNCNEEDLNWDSDILANIRNDLGRSLTGWGLDNLSFFKQDGQLVLRVIYPKGSIDPAAAKRRGAPLGGAGFKLRSASGTNCAVLSYKIRFDKNFNWVIGGKLPGLFGGKGNSGGNIPNGFDGFSTRYMWNRKGMVAVYAYLPTSKRWGTPIHSDKSKLYRGVWHTIKQQVILNTPNRNNGRIRVWLDSKLIIDKTNIFFRKTDVLKINGMMFSTFFGGNSQEWASKLDTYIDFSDFKIGMLGE